MVSKLKWIITHRASFEIRTKWLDSLERPEWRVAAHNNPDETKVQFKPFLFSVLISLCHVKGLWRYSPLLSSDLCNTGILVTWDPRNIKSEPRICIKTWPEPDTDNSNSNNQSPVKIRFRLLFLLSPRFLWEKVHGQFVKIHWICSLKGLLEAILSPCWHLQQWAFLDCTCLCLSP